MGEARRRKLAGTARKPDDPFEAMRRFWCGRSDAGPVEDFRAPVGTVAVTLDVQGVAPSTCLIDATKLMDVVDKISRLNEAWDYYVVVRGVALAFEQAKQGADKTAFPGIGLAALWTALHHPRLGAAMRAAVSDQLRRDGKAHITWQFSPTVGLGLALAEQFVDLENIMADAPRDRVFVYEAPRDAADEVQH